jgi:hypothetical protein
MSRQIKRELREIACIDTKCVIWPVERTIKKFAAIPDREAAGLRIVAKRPSSLTSHQTTSLTRNLFWRARCRLRRMRALLKR